MIVISEIPSGFSGEALMNKPALAEKKSLLLNVPRITELFGLSFI
ncbi:MAG: hypothetical protein U5K00_19565 [Melioribacteraceae bacterium]|nr:hypothetical protein [Melioribacteraceae bacterium]